MAADKDSARDTLFIRLPFALQVAFEDHMHRLEDQALVLALHIKNTLGAQDVLALFRQQLIEPLGKTDAVDRLVGAERNALDLFVMDRIDGCLLYTSDAADE